MESLSPAEEGKISWHCTNRQELVWLVKDSVLRTYGKRRKVRYDKSYTVGHHSWTPYSYSSGAYVWKKTQ